VRDAPSLNSALIANAWSQVLVVPAAAVLACAAPEGAAAEVAILPLR